MSIFVMPENEEKLPEPPKDALIMEVKITEIDEESDVLNKPESE